MCVCFTLTLKGGVVNQMLEKGGRSKDRTTVFLSFLFLSTPALAARPVVDIRVASESHN